MNNQNNPFWEVMQRSYGVYSKEELQKISKAKIAIVGIGCDGGLATLILARMGVGSLTLIDFDKYETSNLNRQPMAYRSTMGQNKARVAEDVIRDINPGIKVQIYEERLTEENASSFLNHHDVIMQCADDMTCRIILHRAAKQLGIPTVTMTGQPPFKAFVSTLLPSGPLYEELFDLPYCKGKLFSDDVSLADKIRSLKYQRAEYADENGAAAGWKEEFDTGNAGWGITPERSYVTGTLQSHEAIRLILGREPLAAAPNAIIINFNNLPGIVTVQSPPNGVSWDYRQF